MASSTDDVAKPRWRCMVEGCKDCGRWQHNPQAARALDVHIRLHHYTEPETEGATTDER